MFRVLPVACSRLLVLVEKLTQRNLGTASLPKDLRVQGRIRTVLTFDAPSGWREQRNSRLVMRSRLGTLSIRGVPPA